MSVVSVLSEFVFERNRDSGMSSVKLSNLEFEEKLCKSNRMTF